MGLGRAISVLWISDSPDTPSGFGNVTRFVCEGLAQRGYRVSILGWQTQQAHEWNGCNVYPSRGVLGSEALFPLLVRHRPNIVIALADSWWLPYFCAPHIRRQMDMTDTPWALYFPVDGDMEGERLPASWIDLLREVDIPIAMSRYGQRIARQCGIASEYIPHGVDLEMFSPPACREEAKRQVGAEGKFVILSDSRNQPRKMLPRLLDVFAGFSRGRPDALLHLHTDPDDDYARSCVYSYDIRADLRELGIESKVRFTPGLVMKHCGGVPLEQLAAYYRAADVHLLASSGEGFGLPTLQAAAAGVVPMAGAYSASQELVEGHGEAIAIAGWSESEFGIRRALIDVGDAQRKLARYYADRALLRERSLACRAFAEPYGWRNVVEAWDALLRSAGCRRGRRKPVAAGRAGLSMQSLLPALNGLSQGISVEVKVAEHEFGRHEASLLGDTQGRYSDVRIPTVPRPSIVGGVKVLRNPGSVGFSPGDASVLARLSRIFPVLSGWVPEGATNEMLGLPGIPAAILRDAEELRLELAQSMLLLNVSGGLSDNFLIDAALFGVPCVGTSAAPPQRILWPDLAADCEAAAFALARRLLTDAAFTNEVTMAARAAWRVAFDAEEEAVVAWLRQSARQRKQAAALAGG